MYAFIIFLAFVLQLIILICYFVLCSRVGKIKKIFYPEFRHENFCLLLYLGRKDDATRMLFNAIARNDNFIYAFHTNNGADKARAILKENYQAYFDALGLELDFDKIKSQVKK